MSHAATEPHHDHLTEAAAALRSAHRVGAEKPTAVPGLTHMAAISRWIDRLPAVCGAPEPETSKAAEWLLDNRYQIKRAFRQVEEDLPPRFYRHLPSLESDELRGYPRIYSIAQTFLAASHLQLSMAALISFVQAYQTAAPLTIGELWALPTMFRLTCLEVLVSTAADLFPKTEFSFDEKPCSLVESLHEPTECIARALSVLRVVASIPWKDFFDRTSVVEEILSRDPAAIYSKIDFDTRDSYRKAVEELARGSEEVTEWAVARAVLAKASSAHDRSLRHVGYWLVGEGRSTFETILQYRPRAWFGVQRWIVRNASLCYPVALLAASASALLLPALYLSSLRASTPIFAAELIIALIPASIIAITLVHWAITLIVPPRVLPKLNFEKGIPREYATAVVMPVIIGAANEVAPLIERLQLHWLSNPDPNLCFAILSDLKDAPTEETPTDSAVIQTLTVEIRRLNERFGRDKAGPFLLLHRARRFNPSQGSWMGWERKRGKLEQLNHLILDGINEQFRFTEGDLDLLKGVRFVVTGDADTVLPPGSVARLVGTLAHPLNAAEFDTKSGRLSSGYTVVQPRVEIMPETGDRTIFSRIYAGDNAIDIYSRAVSNVYQDLFGTAVYVGKGVYDVAAFQRSLASCIPENSLLSHDLFEGAHGRVALASDIVIYDSFPESYLEYVKRWHRWIRGDWQLLPWLFGRVPAANRTTKGNQLSALDRWKILENLRRSVIPLALAAFAISGWLSLPAEAWAWTMLTIGAPAAYLFTDVVTGFARGHRRGVIQNTARQFIANAARWFLSVAFLLSDALVSLDAIGRTLWRLFASRRMLLEWTSAAHLAAKLADAKPRQSAWQSMWAASAISVLIFCLLAIGKPVALFAASPLLFLWFASPEIAIWVGRPIRRYTERLEEPDRAFLRQVARRTWLFFETFVGPDENWLPPDNFQEDPRPEIAHRTSPTNIGMYLLSTLGAWDLGYIGTRDLALRVQSTFDTLERLQKHRGHILNWYDTQTLAPLDPRYVSTVDSGNLAVCLVTLMQGCNEATSTPLLQGSRWDGLTDTLRQLAGALEPITGPHARDAVRATQEMLERIGAVRGTPDAWYATLSFLLQQSLPALGAMIGEAIAGPAPPEVLRQIQIWLERSRHHCVSMQQAFEALLPWIALHEATPLPGRELARKLALLLPPTCTPAEIKLRSERALDLLRQSHESTSPQLARWIEDISVAIERGARAQQELVELLRAAARRAHGFAYAMDFGLLFDQETRVFHIGYNASSDQLDPHFYDLLASEARLASYFAIVKHDVPAEHWFFLGRPITKLSGKPSLLSWNGSMFEYLMPALLLRSSPTTLLARSEQSAVEMQRRYARKLGLPWGVSESAYGARDAEHHYQYRAFGIPGLGLRRGLAEDLVIAPYATVLALAVRPSAAVHNLQRLSGLGLFGSYGFVEAGDFTPERTPPGQTHTVVRAYMAHHQGMAFSAITNALKDGIFVRRFSSDLQMRTGELLLQERIPSELPPELVAEEESIRPARIAPTKAPPRAWRPKNFDAMPQLHMLGNGRLATWISESGSGGLWWHRHALTRWMPDGVCENHGSWVFFHDPDTGALWSAAIQPTGIASHDSQVTFHPHMAEFHRRDYGIATRMEVVVAPGDDLEIRRITISNESDKHRPLRVTSYGEVVLAPPRDDERHPAFSKLFVGCEHIGALSALLFTRRPRAPDERSPALLHRAILDDSQPAAVRFTSDRAAFLGRHGDMRRPQGAVGVLEEQSGWTLDPIMSLQIDLELKPRESRQIAFITLAAGSRESAFEIAERYATLGSLDWAFNDANREATKETQQLDIEPERLPEFQQLASLLIAPQSISRSPLPAPGPALGQQRLWAFGISGDLPILLVRIGDPHASEPLRTLLRAFSLWRRRLFAIDLVILRTGFSGYDEPVREKAFSLIREAGLQELMGRNGGIHLLFADQLVPDDKALLEGTANFILDETAGSLGTQITRAFASRTLSPMFEGTRLPSGVPRTGLTRAPALQFDNGLGGFSQDGSEYDIYLEPRKVTPAPWCNVLANESFGTLVSESGLGFTWSLNSGEFRLTPWTNDPILNPAGEILYLRDEETAELWTPTPAPAGADTAHSIKHGMGYTHWKSRSHALDQILTVFVAPRDSVKFVRLQVTNLQNQPRRITATLYVEWIMGALRSVSRPHVNAHYDAEVGAIFAQNTWNPEFRDRIAFLAANRPAHSITTDRRDFVGRNGNVSAPSGLLRWDLGGCAASAGEACGAYQVHLDIASGGTIEVTFLLGDAESEGEVSQLLARWREGAQIDHAFEESQAVWRQRLEAVEVRTPDPAFDLMVNRWLPYQAMSSRILARSGFYQSGGAIGFRDQLQDVLAILFSEPRRARAHILECAAHQFEEGDVLHWWHPPAGRGVRTRCSDDLLWLPFVASHYVRSTGDISILDERIAFLAAPVLTDKEDDRYGLFEVGATKHTLFEHCLRAIEKGVTRGPHGLPLIGAGDWNDGMNRVGPRGRGESVWLGWFAIAAIEGFCDLAARYGRQQLAADWKTRSEQLRTEVERSAWDGNWYVRAFDDNGNPWGSHSNDECRIDSIAQSWSALAEGQNSDRIRTALRSAERELLSENDRLVRLLAPPFDATRRDPGYIKAYPPGIRENGGQYSHAAAWLGHALAEIGDPEGAWRVFDVLNPIKRTQTPNERDHYRAEPYVLAADIAGAPPHTGRAGWTWYTGAAAWTWRLGVERILGLSLQNGAVAINPCLPPHWGQATVTVRARSGSLHITVDDPEHIGCGDTELTVDGNRSTSPTIAFPTDGSTRNVHVRIMSRSAREPALAKTA